MNFLNGYNRVEKWSSKRPVAFWALTILVTSIPITIYYGQLRSLLLLDVSLKGYVIFSIMLVSISIPTILFQLKSRFKKKIVKDLESLELRLSPEFSFVVANGRFYSNEILECFDEYFLITAKLESKYPKEFGVLPIRLRPKVKDKDWVSEDMIMPLKSDIKSLIFRLK